MKRSEEGGGEGAKIAGWICVWSLWSVCQPWDHLEILCHLQGIVWATTRWCSSSASGRHLLPLGRLFQTGKSGGGCKGLARKSAQRAAPQFLQRECSVSALKEIPFLASRQAAFCSNKLVVFFIPSRFRAVKLREVAGSQSQPRAKPNSKSTSFPDVHPILYRGDFSIAPSRLLHCIIPGGISP